MYFCADFKIHEDLDSGKPSITLLYVTPELSTTTGFLGKLSKLNARGLLNLIAIDEVCSLWPTFLFNVLDYFQPEFKI